jgi:hypothetical protein
MGDKSEDTRARLATLGDVMGVEACRITARGDGVKIETACRRFRQQQRGYLRQPSGQQTVLMLSLRALGVVGGKGRLREDMEPSEQPERLFKIKVTDVTAAFLVQQLQGEQTEQRTRGRDHTRAGIISLGNELIESDTCQKRQEEENTGDPCA